MTRRLRDRVLPPLIGLVGPWIVKSLGSTWSVRRLGLHPRDERARGVPGRYIVALWHCTLLPMAYVHRDQDGIVLASKHGDGELITRALAGLGFVVARGSTTRGGAEGMRAMIRATETHTGDLALTPDGPRGPARKAHPGLVYLAALTGYPILPFTVAAKSCWRFASWDRFEVPKPFTRIAVVSGDPIPVGREDLERVPDVLARYEAAMAIIEERARARLTEAW